MSGCDLRWPRVGAQHPSIRPPRPLPNKMKPAERQNPSRGLMGVEKMLRFSAHGSSAHRANRWGGGPCPVGNVPMRPAIRGQTRHRQVLDSNRVPSSVVGPWPRCASAVCGRGRDHSGRRGGDHSVAHDEVALDGAIRRESPRAMPRRRLPSREVECSMRWSVCFS
jgi:hypothetical protein